MNEERNKNLISILKKYADENNFKLNPDIKILNGIISALLRNKDINGEIYCPCRIITGNKTEDKKIICPCIYHKDEIKQDGHCKCRLFWKR
jgi:ferredoxin-thioredoxin reductase catalytic subunit